MLHGCNQALLVCVLKDKKIENVLGDLQKKFELGSLDMFGK